MKISLGSWAFSFGPYTNDPVPFDRTVKRLAEAGYDGVEICGFPPHVTLDSYPTRSSRQEIVNLLRDNGLGVSGYAADFAGVNPAAAGSREQVPRHLPPQRRDVRRYRQPGHPRGYDRRAGLDPGLRLPGSLRPHGRSLAPGRRNRPGCRHPAGLGIRAGLCLQQAFRSRSHARHGSPSELQGDVRHFARLHVRRGRSAPARS